MPLKPYPDQPNRPQDAARRLGPRLEQIGWLEMTGRERRESLPEPMRSIVCELVQRAEEGL